MTRTGACLRSSIMAGFAVIVAGSQARAADDGYANVFSSMATAFGVIKADPVPDIAYRERPPLVLPPQPGLPKPAESHSRSAAWPNDPDLLRHKRDLEDAHAPRRSIDQQRDDQVTAGELAKGRGASEPAGPSGCNPNGTNRNCLLVSPDELKRESDQYAAANPTSTDEVVGGKEPDRVFLTQPPKGYLKATKTVKATTEAPRHKLDGADARTYYAKPADPNE